ncbi:MAG: CpaD family pilus assembly protein [Hyphomicrobiaceae bacterium]
MIPPMPTPAPRRHGAVVLSVVLAAAIVASCGDFHRLSSEEALHETNPALGHRIAFAARDEVLDIELPPPHVGLSANQYADVYRFAVRYRDEATGPLSLAAPRGHGPRGALVADVQRALDEAGVARSRVVRGRAAHGPYLTLAWQRPVAVAPECGHWPRDAAREPERVPYPDFGCATQRNLAGMVANSRDLMGSQPESPASSERRTRVWSKYVSGGETAAAAATPESSTDAKPKGVKK